MQRYEIIQRLIDFYGYKSYLEIGLGNFNTWKEIRCDYKVGVDPGIETRRHFFMNEQEPRLEIYGKTSDDYFGGCVKRFDLIFIDGLHIAEQVERDIMNSLNHLSPNGTIVIHDCNPPTLAHAGEKPEIYFKGEGESRRFIWCGTVWKAAMFLSKIPGINFFTVDTDWGVGVLRRNGGQLNYLGTYPDENDWDYFDTNRVELLNLISIDEFNKRYPDGTHESLPKSR